MSSLLCETAIREQQNCDVHTGVVTAEESYATAPMAAVGGGLMVRPTLWNEEELYTSFEQAISERVLAVRSRLSRISGPLSASYCGQNHTDTMLLLDISEQSEQPEQPECPASQAEASSPAMQTAQKVRPRLFSRRWQCRVVYGSLALICTMLGFDLMGMLVLYMH